MFQFELMQEPDECILSVRRCFGIKRSSGIAVKPETKEKELGPEVCSEDKTVPRIYLQFVLSISGEDRSHVRRASNSRHAEATHC